MLETSLQQLPSGAASEWSLAATPTCRPGGLLPIDRVSLLERKHLGLGREVAAVRGALSGQSFQERLIICLITGVRARPSHALHPRFLISDPVPGGARSVSELSCQDALQHPLPVYHMLSTKLAQGLATTLQR